MITFIRNHSTYSMTTRCNNRVRATLPARSMPV